MAKLFNRKSDLLWFMDAMRESEHEWRINRAVDINSYLHREHKVLLRPDFEFKEKTFHTAKIVLQTLKTIVNFHTSYTVGNPANLTGDKELVDVMNKIYKVGQFAMRDYQITKDLITYGNAFEYVYLDKDNTIKSKVFNNIDSYPLYDENMEYYAFVDYWKDATDGGTEHYTVYYPDRVETYVDRKLIDTSSNLTGLPIHYKRIEKAEYDMFGEPFVNDLILVMDEIEELLSRLSDAVETLSLNPIAYTSGGVWNTPINSNMVGAVISFEDGGELKYANATMDYSNIKLLLDSLLQQFYGIACVPSSVLGQSNVANVSEVSLSMLFNSTDNVARDTMYSLKEGFQTRWEYMRKLMEEYQGETIADEVFNSLDCTFNVNRPVDTTSAMEEMKMQRDMGAISIQTIIENSKHTSNTALELDRLAEEKENNKTPIVTTPVPENKSTEEVADSVSPADKQVIDDKVD